MDLWFVATALAVAALLWIILFSFRRRSSSSSPTAPPGPFQWPIIGCLPSVSFRRRHRAFYELSQRFGPLISLPIGSSNIFLVHGTELAMEVLKTKDAQFCSRPTSMTGKYIGFHHSDPNLCPLNENWKAVRKAFSNELMAPFRLNSQIGLRREEIFSMVNSLLRSCGGDSWSSVNVRKVAEGVVTSIMKRMLFGNHYCDTGADGSSGVIAREFAENFEDYLTEGNFLWGELNMADYFPALEFFDFQGLKARFKKLMSKLEPLFQVIIEEHRKQLKESGNVIDEEKKDVIDVLLLQNQLSDKQIMGILSDALLPGISTTAAAIEWAMAELAANPHTLYKTQQELDTVVGKSRLVKESDIQDLPYLQAVAKEVLRLHPSAPLDDPHLNEEPAVLGGYRIPAKSTIFVNLWALGQDPLLWKNPTEFNPERFLGSDISVHGSHFELIPFSSGRRKCPAHHLAMLKLQHVVAALVHGFEWRSEGVVNLEDADGIVANPKNPLWLSARLRLPAEAYSM